MKQKESHLKLLHIMKNYKGSYLIEISFILNFIEGLRYFKKFILFVPKR